MERTKKGDFIEIKYTGYVNGEPFDSNIEEDLKKINEKEKARESVVCIGEGFVIPGLDKALEGKEIGKEYEIEVSPKEGFGERRRELIRVLPLKAFTEKKVNPQPGMVLALDNSIVKIIAVSGARVSTDFNNPLSGKNLKYKFKIARKVESESEKAKALFEVIFKFVPEFEVKEKIVVKGPKVLEGFVKAFNDKFKELIGKELDFEEKKEEKKEGSKEEKKA